MEELNTVDAVVEEVVIPQNEQVEVTEVETEVVENVESEVVTDTQTEVEKVVQTPEENAKYAELRRKYEAEKVEAAQAARDKLIEEQYGESHNIHTESEFKAAMARQKEQEAIAAIQSEKNYSEEDAKELFEARRIKAEREAQQAEMQKTQQQKAAEEKENQEFLDYFERENNRGFDPKKDKIPGEVWERVKNKVSLTQAYMEHELKQLKLGTSVAKLNAENAGSAIGSVNGDGQKIDGPLTQAQVDNMSQAEMMARWPEVKKVMGML